MGFFNVFINAGMMTFYQNNVPVEVMGRVTSIFQLIQSVIQVVFILAVGFAGDLVSLRVTIVSLSLVMLLSSLVFSYVVLKPAKMTFYLEVEEEGAIKIK